jgi:hypothetical protein
VAPGPSSGESGATSTTTPLPPDSGEVVTDPIDSRFLTYMPFGTRSFWLQPWRAYLDTWPASRLLESVGINFNVSPQQAEATAQLLHDSGFKLARMPINWAALSYENPTTFLPDHLANITARLTALHRHGLRPLITLDAYAGAPTPEKRVTLETTVEAPAGATTVQLSLTSALQVVPRKTGFNELGFGGSPDMLISSVSPTGVATLSRPLGKPLAAGPHPGTSILYAPFAAPTLSTGLPNPEFLATMGGWLNYVAMVCREAASVVGPEGFDLEIWNELTFESQFLNAENYYSTSPASGVASALTATGSPTEAKGERERGAEPNPGRGEDNEMNYSSDPGPASEAAYGAAGGQPAEEGSEGEASGGGEPEGGARVRGYATTEKRQVSQEIRKALLNTTVEFVRNPLNGISPAVGITNGFASETPFPSGADAPLGLTALSKHPYVGVRQFPSDYKVEAVTPLNALGLRDTLKGSFAPLFIPSYQALLPEYTLTGLSTETLVRDLGPLTTYVYDFPHGRYVGPVGGGPVQKWITEYNLSPWRATVVGPDGVTPQTGSSATLSAADKQHFHAKVLLRSLVAMVNKGMTREYFFAAAPGAFSLIDPSFFTALEAQPGTYPGDQLGGETMDGFRNLLTHVQGPGPSGAAQQLTLLSIAQNGNHAQFSGDGTTAHPSLYDRDVLAVLPFQSSPKHFVVPVYVMTSDMLTLYEPSASPTNINRFDLPDETFRITLGNLPETAGPPAVSAYDPLRNQATPAHLVSRVGTTAVFELAATDYPRLLSIDYTGS